MCPSASQDVVKRLCEVAEEPHFLLLSTTFAGTIARVFISCAGVIKHLPYSKYQVSDRREINTDTFYRYSLKIQNL